MKPEVNKDGVIMTLNGMGHCIPELTEFSQAFVNFSKELKRPVLDIGAAYGPATIAALKQNVQVVANDIDPRHLAYLQEAVEEPYKKNLTLKLGRVPNDVSFEANYFGAIHVSQVLHFLQGDEIEETISLLYQWLVPQGKIFIIVGTPYMSLLKEFIPIYENRKKAGDLWPGQIMDMAHYCSNPEFLQQTPRFMN